MPSDLTFARLKNTTFEELYKKLYFDTELSDTNCYKLLSISILLLNQSDLQLKKLGYRIIVLYTNKTGDYKPLYDITINIGLFPISKQIEKIIGIESNSFIQTFSSSFLETYKTEEIYISEQQDQLEFFFNENLSKSLAIVAPTSYGKSDLIIRGIRSNIDNNICIIVPSKALISQTKQRILSANINGISKVITHPDMYSDNDKKIKCILTQERLLRLLNLNTNLSFDTVFIDEAHNLLENDNRNNLLASSIIILNKRNSSIKLKFLTPFLEDCNNLRLKYIRNDIKEFKIDEYIKTEKFFIYDFRSNKKALIYDQFLNKFYDINESNSNALNLINSKKKSKNIIYLNKPKSIEKLAIELSNTLPSITSEKIDKVCEELEKYFHIEYNLIRCLRKGIVYHHGSIPENVRSYIEKIYRDDENIKFIVTSSTLLEGVNIPAESMFILDPRKGRGYLTASQFKNLIGRVCRFNEIFSESDNLFKLVPEIYLIGSSFCSSAANLETFLAKRADISKIVTDSPRNVLIDKVEVNSHNDYVKKEVDEFLKNFDEGIISDESIKIAETDIGKSCFKNNVSEIDILTHENIMQEKIIELKKSYNKNLSDSYQTFVCIKDIFIPFLKDIESNNNLKRLNNDPTCKFYSMFLNWRLKNASFKEMINQFLKYWNKIISTVGLDNYVYVGKWGDAVREGFRELWTDISRKNDSQRINLAIVRIKEEQDFLDNTLIKFIEVLNDLGILDLNFYNNIKYGTDNEDIIALIKNGLSPMLSQLIYEKYDDYFVIDSSESALLFDREIINEMKKNNENEILILEAFSSCNW